MVGRIAADTLTARRVFVTGYARYRVHQFFFRKPLTGEDVNHPPLAQDDYAMRAIDKFLCLRGNEEDSEALCGKFIDRRSNLSLRTDIDTSSRFV